MLFGKIELTKSARVMPSGSFSQVDLIAIKRETYVSTENQKVKWSSSPSFISLATPFSTSFLQLPIITPKNAPNLKMADSKIRSISTKEDQKIEVDQNLDTWLAQSPIYQCK